MPRPIIGLTCDYDVKDGTSKLYEGYYYAILKAGGLPFLIANIGKDDVFEILNPLDGILFTGGQDVDPAYFGEAPHPKLGQVNPYRDELEISLCKMALDKDLPILGICRGIQLINIAMGGTIYQDLKSQWDGGELQKHSQLAPDWYGTHEIELVKDSKLERCLGVRTLYTNSFHHQSVREPAKHFSVTATCKDGVIEAIESRHHSFAVGVQWHPERMWERDIRMLNLFKGLVEAVRYEI